MKGAIPYPSTCDPEEVATIKKFVEYIVRNGSAFESKVKEKESENSKFSFLFPDRNEEGYRYYCWLLFCSSHLYTDHQISAIENDFKTRIQQSAPGSVELTEEDHELLVSLIHQNNGSKDCIKGIRKWLVDRAHSLSSSIQTICDSMRHNAQATFTQYLHVVYVVNDLLFNGSGATTKGPYTRILDSDPVPVPLFKVLLPYLPWLLQTSFRLAGTDSERERVQKMVTLWTSRGFIDSFLADQLSKMIIQAEVIPFPRPATLTSPYPQNLPPPNFSALPPPPPPPSQHGLSFTAPPPPPPHFFGIPIPPPGQPPLPPHPPVFFAPPPPGAPLAFLDLQTVPVGSMANILKGALKGGHPRYTPVDANAISRSMPPTVEPGRLEARIAEFYKKYDSLAQKS